MGRKPKREPSPEKPHRLTLAQLAAYDDVCTDVMVDNAYSKLFKIRKYGTNGNKYLPVRGVKEDDVPHILLHKLIVEKDFVTAERALWKLPGVRNYRLKLAPAEMADFREHFDKYVHIYKTDCPWEVSTTNRYTITTHEAAVTARRRIKQGEVVKYLVGTLVPLTVEESANLDITNRNFSIVTSARKKGSSIFLGPARFANHDCNANARLEVRGSDGMQVVAVQNIDIGEELTVSYGNDYFGPDNIDCLCHTCEVLERNGWTSHEAAGLSRSVSPFPEEVASEDPPMPRKRGRPRKIREPDISKLPSESITAPKKREYNSDDASDSSPGPASKKRKFGPSPSKLQESWTPPSSTTSELGECGPASAPLPELRQNEDVGLSTPASPVSSRHDRPVSANASTDSKASPGSRLKRPTKFFQLGRMTARLLGQSMEPDSMSTPPSPPPSTTPTDQSPVSLTDDKGSEHPGSIIELESVEIVKFENDKENILPTRPLPTGNDLDAPEAITTLTTTTTTKLASVLPSVEEPSIIEEVTTSRLTIGTAQTTVRVPGDYILTRKLLAQPHDRWIKCTNSRCPPLYFVQPNGYQTRRECPRCERHSMLYGFPWPKTDPDPRKLMERKKKEEVSAYKRQGRSGKGSWVEGGGDEEERVMDHRTVHRFLFPGEEREISRKGLLREAEEKRKELCGRLLEGVATPDRGTESVGREASYSSTPDDGFERRKSKRFTRDAMYAEA